MLNINYKFDVVIISSLLHEVEDATSILEKLHSIINPNTIVHVNVPNAKSFHRILAYEMGLIDSVYEMSPTNLLLQQHSVFDLKSLSSLINDCGFEIIDSGSYFIKPFSHNQMAQLIKEKFLNMNSLDGLFKMTKYMPDLGSEIYANFKLR